MAMKIAVLALAVFTIVSANEKVRRQAPSDFNEYFNQFQESMKPFVSGFPNMPNGFGSFPSFPGFPGGSSGGSSGQEGSTGGSNQYKRQASPYTLTEWFNKFQENTNNFSGNLPFKPPTFGQNPFVGTSETTQNEN